MGVYTGYFDAAVSRHLEEARVDVYECADGERVQIVLRRASVNRFPPLVRWLLRRLANWKYTRERIAVSGETHLQNVFGGADAVAKAQAFRDEMERRYPGDLWQIVSTTVNESLPLERLRPKQYTREKGESSDVYVVVEKSRLRTLECLERAAIKRGQNICSQDSLPEQCLDMILQGKEDIWGVVADLDARLSHLEQMHSARGESNGTTP